MTAAAGFRPLDLETIGQLLYQLCYPTDLLKNLRATAFDSKNSGARTFRQLALESFSIKRRELSKLNTGGSVKEGWTLCFVHI